MEPDLNFLIFFACSGTVLFIGTCVVMWRYYDMDLILRNAPQIRSVLSVRFNTSRFD